jgi:digeranylgeranylglycerophospholipid reductase
MSSRLLMTDMLYLAPNERYDQLMRDMQSLDHGTLERANEGDVLAILRLLRLRDVPLLGRLAKHRFDR